MRLAHDNPGGAPIECVYLQRGRTIDFARAGHMSTLGLAPNATVDDAKEARRRLARELHPDITGNTNGEARLALVNAAYDAVVIEASGEPEGVVDREFICSQSFRDLDLDARRTLYIVGPARFSLFNLSGSRNQSYEIDRLANGRLRERTSIGVHDGVGSGAHVFTLLAGELLRVFRRIH